MKNAQIVLARSWEKIAFWGMALVFVVVLVLWFTGFGHEKAGGAPMHPVPQQRHYLNLATAFAFCDELPPLNIKNPNPFFFVVRPSGGRHQHETITPPAEVKVVVKTTVVTQPKAAVTQRLIEYLGSITTASGRSVALLLDRNSGKTAVVQAGAMFSKYKIKSFSPKEAIAEDDKGAEVVFALGRQTGIPLE